MVETHWLCVRNPDIPVKERSLYLAAVGRRAVRVRSIRLALPNVVIGDIVGISSSIIRKVITLYLK